MTEIKNRHIAHYGFNDAENIGKDLSGLGNDATPEGTSKPIIESVGGN